MGEGSARQILASCLDRDSSDKVKQEIELALQRIETHNKEKKR